MGAFFMNPGAICFPNDGWIGAQYAVLDWDGRRWKPEFRAVRYDKEAFRHPNQVSGFLSTWLLARIFMKEAAEGRDISTDFFLLARHLAIQASTGDSPYFPDEVWEGAEREFTLPGGD
jgi:hypothetical protein